MSKLIWLSSRPKHEAHAILLMMAWSAMSAIIFLAILAAVFATGQTFGQRCEVFHTKDRPEWRECVERMVKGGDV